MAGITLDELTQELRNRGFAGFLTSDLHRYLDWGFRKIARMANWDWEQTQAVVTQAAGDYTIPVGGNEVPVLGEVGIPLLRDLTKIIDVTQGQAHILTPMSEEKWADWMATDLSVGSQGTPHEYFFEWGKQLYILPPPDSERTYHVYYYQYLGDAASGLEAMPTDWEEGVLLAAEGICHYRARQPDFGQLADDRLSELVAEMLVEQNMKDPDFQERVDSPWSRVR